MVVHRDCLGWADLDPDDFLDDYLLKQCYWFCLVADLKKQILSTIILLIKSISDKSQVRVIRDFSYEILPWLPAVIGLLGLSL